MWRKPAEPGFTFAPQRNSLGRAFGSIVLAAFESRRITSFAGFMRVFMRVSYRYRGWGLGGRQLVGSGRVRCLQTINFGQGFFLLLVGGEVLDHHLARWCSRFA